MTRARGISLRPASFARQLSLIGAVLLVAAAAAADPSAASARNAAPDGGPGHWSQVTSSGTPIIADIGLVRGSDGVLHVLWTFGTSPFRINDTPIAANGAPRPKAVVASGWFLATDPDAATTSSGLTVFWNGLKTESASGPQGTFLATRARSGGHWAVAGSPIPPILAAPFTSSSDSAAAGADGKPWVAFSGTDSLIVEHLGHPEVQIAPALKCCLYDQALATDGQSGQTWLSYASLITGNQGVFARKLKTSGVPSAPAVLLPGSRGHGSAIIPEQRIAITGRGKGGPGVYAAYGAGYPFYRSLNVLRLGTSKPVKLAGFTLTDQLTGTAIAADPRGRLWAAWFTDGASPALFVRRSSATATTFGKTVRIPLPAGTTDVWKVYLSAQTGRLDVLALLTRHDNEKTSAYWSTQVLPPH